MRSKYYFGQINIEDPYTWTFDHKNHKHFTLYKGVNIVGIGFGLYSDYGSAQRLYIKRGYIPDGHGATYNYEYVTTGKKYLLDDDLELWFTKNLGN